MAELNFNAANVKPNEGYPDPLPNGKYPMQIIESGMKPTKDNQGSYLQLTLQVIDGEFKGRKIIDRLNLQNNNPVAVEIAYGNLSAICHACNVIQCQDSQQLHGIPMEVAVGVKPAKGDFSASNEVKSYKPLGGATAFAAQPGFNQTAPASAPQMAQAPVGQPQPWQQVAQQPSQPAPAPAPAQPAPAQQQQPAQPWQQTQAAPALEQQAPAAQAPSSIPPWAQQPQ